MEYIITTFAKPQDRQREHKSIIEWVEKWLIFLAKHLDRDRREIFNKIINCLAEKFLAIHRIRFDSGNVVIKFKATSLQCLFDKLNQPQKVYENQI